MWREHSCLPRRHSWRRSTDEKSGLALALPLLALLPRGGELLQAQGAIAIVVALTKRFFAFRIVPLALMRIPSDADQRSEVMAIAIPN